MTNQARHNAVNEYALEYASGPGYLLWLSLERMTPLIAVLATLGLLAAIKLVTFMLYIVMFTVIVQAVLSLVNPYSPAMPLLNSLVRPFLRPFQRLVPPIGNVDLSPLFVVVVCQLLLMVPVAYLQAAVGRLF